jgi:hypothetical protein
MTFQRSPDDYLSAIEKSINKKFRFRTEIGSLLTISQEKKLGEVLDDVLFFSKFISHAYIVLKREGTNSETTLPLQAEFKTNIEKLHTLLRTIVKDTDESFKQNFVARFLSMKPECMETLLALAHELTWLKNFQLDNAQ